MITREELIKLCNEIHQNYLDEENPNPHFAEYIADNLLPNLQEESVWVISYDGYYPYCKRCMYEPEKPLMNVDNRTPYCPNCGAKMKKER